MKGVCRLARAPCDRRRASAPLAHPAAVERDNLAPQRSVRALLGQFLGHAQQPFGGVGLSGTGPKAGGPNYLRRFATEQVVTINTAAAGGNASLLAAEEE